VNNPQNVAQLAVQLIAHRVRHIHNKQSKCSVGLSRPCSRSTLMKN